MGKQKPKEAVTTFIGTDAVVEGTVEFEGTIRIDGGIHGSIISKSGTLIIGENAHIKAEISVNRAVIMGVVEGTVEAKHCIEAYPPSRINGNIEAPVISIEPGVIFNGLCRMSGKNVTPLRTPETTGNSGITEDLRGS
ncbi:Polymer-forming bactofilin [Olavius algarvensis associated proteobacterium Delta 3]|nr:Polymer-forming bactofilin [Olavius algarvensis associated proteobacterium Delta 3]